MIDYRERRLRFWCQKVLPLVYDESLSYYELLCKTMKHVTEAETDVSALEKWLADLDAEAVKKVYSEWPLVATKEGNNVTLNLRSKNFVTSVSAEESSPITVSSTGGTTTGSLDPEDESSPTGTTRITNNVILDIDTATGTKKGAMSAEDKQKVDRLYNSIVAAGENITVNATTAANGDTTYTVGVDPNFKVNVQNDYLVGDWEWNACLSGKTNCAVWNLNVGQGAVTVEPASLQSGSFNIENTADRQGLKGIVVPHTVNAQYNDAAHPCIGVSYAAASDYPFSTVNAANPVVDGETYFTTLNSIDIKVQFTGTGVANREFTIYLLSQKTGSGLSFSNQYLTNEDPYYPSYGVPYIPAKYNFTTDQNGFASFTIPAGLTATTHQTSSLPNVATNIRVMNIVATGRPADLAGNVKIDSCTIAVKAKLN